MTCPYQIVCDWLMLTWRNMEPCWMNKIEEPVLRGQLPWLRFGKHGAISSPFHKKVAWTVVTVVTMQ